jgi:putative RecB family exonuclease
VEQRSPARKRWEKDHESAENPGRGDTGNSGERQLTAPGRSEHYAVRRTSDTIDATRKGSRKSKDDTVPTFSHSKISTFQQCPQKYKFRYIDEIPSESRGIELLLGVSVHQALEELYQSAMIGQTLSCDEMVSYYRRKWDESYTPQIRIVRSGTTARDYFENGHRMLRTFYRRFHPFTQSATLALEESFLFPLSDRHEIRGIIDRIARAGDDGIEIHDYKTSRRLPNAMQVSSDRQLALYEMALRHRWPLAQRISLIWHYLAFDKEICIAKTVGQLEAVRQETLALIESIGAATTFPTRVTPLCDWCDYKAICPAMEKR